MKAIAKRWAWVSIVFFVLGGLALSRLGAMAPQGPSRTAGDRVAVVFSAGYETDGRDGGRPVALIAAALDVSPDVFREAFRGVTPAAGGREPGRDQVRKNKTALMKALGPLGVTNDRLDEVSNHYRYNRGRGETWRHSPAEAYATIRDGKVVGFTIVQAGSGYNSAPKVTVPGFSTAATASLAFNTDLKTNGSIKAIAIEPR